MASRRVPLSTPAQLSEHLLESTGGKGLDAFFGDAPAAESQSVIQGQATEDPPPLPNEPANESTSSELLSTEPPPTQPDKDSSPVKQARKQTNLQASKQASFEANKQAILQLSDTAFEILRQPVQKTVTFRLADDEVDWLKDAAYLLSKEFRNNKVSQVDILRISLKLFENALILDKPEMLRIIEKSKQTSNIASK